MSCISKSLVAAPTDEAPPLVWIPFTLLTLLSIAFTSRILATGIAVPVSVVYDVATVGAAATEMWPA